MGGKIKLYLNTVKYLKPSQIYYRIFNRMKRELYKREFIKLQVPGDLKVEDSSDYLIPELDFDINYLGKFNAKDILDDHFKFINITNKVDLAKAWNNKELQHLWRYNLHYFEYLFVLAYEFSKDKKKNQYYNKFKYLIENWIDNNSFAFGDGWHPYTISLRLTNWITVYQIFQEEIKKELVFDKKFKESVYLQYQYLKFNLEKDVLGNHYFENIKALIIGSVFFKDDIVRNKFKNELLEQLDEQILKDGMHFELSPMYHKIILEDLIKMTYWLKDDTIYSQLISYIQKMLNVVYSFEVNFGKTPAFNDSADGISKDYKVIIDVCKKYFNLNQTCTDSLEDSGFYIMEDQSKKLIFDTGDICPAYLPAHGHCDALSFELSINNIPLIVNSGTYQYESGKWREYFRSTKAHNTVGISDREQSQFWGSFRVANRIKKVKRKNFDYKGIRFYAGSYVSSYGDEHKRFVGYIDTSAIIILDYVKAKTKDNVKSYLHFTPETRLKIENNIVFVVSGEEEIRITAIASSKINIGQGWYSEQFNLKEINSVLIFAKDSYKDYLGYLINFDSNGYKITESENEIKIIGNNDIIINYEEMRDMI